LPESLTEDFRTKLMTPEVFTAITGKLNDCDLPMGWAAMDVIGKLVAHGQFNRQFMLTSSISDLQQRISKLKS
jgi:hypothetical protein